MPGHGLVAHDVGDGDAATRPKDSEDLPDQSRLVVVGNQVDHAVGHDHIDRLVGHKRKLTANLLGLAFEAPEVLDGMHRMLAKPGLEAIQVKGEILDPAAHKSDVLEANPPRHNGGCAPRQGEHRVVHLHADDVSLRPNDLCGDEANLPSTAAQIEDGVSFPHIARRITAAVIALKHVLGNDLEVLGVVVDGAAQGSLAPRGCSRVARPDGIF